MENSGWRQQQASLRVRPLLMLLIALYFAASQQKQT